MRRFLLSKIIALLLTQALLLPSPVAAQDARQQTRPRRVGDARREAPPATQPGTPAPPQETTVLPEAMPSEFQFPEPDFSPAAPVARLDAEPPVRVALATNARSVSVSTSGALLYATDLSVPPAPLGVARVRVEPRSFPALVPAAEDASAAPDETANGGAKQDHAEKAGDAKREKRDGSDGAAGGKNGAATAGGRGVGAGLPAVNRSAGTRGDSSGENGKSGGVRPGGVRLTSRVSTAALRGSVVYASGAGPLVEARTPVTFIAADSASPLRFNEKAYRGRLEVFANRRGTLTVVNVLPLEEYVRGVVPNELSPGGWPALEALKAQAVAARTYAVRHRGQFAADGYDLLPTTRSQVYGGLSTEHPLTDRAVAETRGRILTHHGETVDALYTSTCGGRTEHAENIFGGAAPPYLRARACSVDEGDDDEFDAHLVKTSRDPATLRDAEHAGSARDAALLATHGFRLFATRLTDEWLASPLSSDDARALLEGAALLARQRIPLPTSDPTRPPGFATALSEAVDGERRGDVLLNPSDVQYLLAFRDADEIPARHRADVALLLRDGHLALHPDATLRPRQPMSRARALRAAVSLLEARNLLRLQKATARPSASGSLVLRPASGRGGDRTLAVDKEAYLFRAFGVALFPVQELAIVGGEPVVYHLSARGEVDYLEARPAPNGASAERFSPFTNWTATLTPAEVSSRLARWARGTGQLVDLRVAARGASRRVTDLEVVGASGTAHVRGGRIRSALGLREQLFVIERRYDESGRVSAFVFRGRGWGHGVGMCQVGAYGLARAGLSYEKILKSYYTGVELTKLY